MMESSDSDFWEKLDAWFGKLARKKTNKNISYGKFACVFFFQY